MIWFPDVPSWFEDEVNDAFALQYRHGDDESGFLAALAATEGDEAAARAARQAVTDHPPVHLFGLLILAFPEHILI